MCRPCDRVMASRMTLDSPCLRVPRMIPSSRHSMPGDLTASAAKSRKEQYAGYRWRIRRLVGKFQTHLAVTLRVVAPVLPHLHEQEEMHLLFEHVGDLLAGGFAYGANRAPLFAQNDLLLAIAFHIDHLLDANRAVFLLLPFLGLDMGGIG